MSDLNERQAGVLRALAQSPSGLPQADLDGRVVRALERRGLVRRQGDRVRATPAGKREVNAPAARPEANAPPLPEPAAPSTEPDVALRPDATERAPTPLPPPTPEPGARDSRPRVEGPSNPATAERVKRVRRAYEVVRGEEAVAPGNVDYALNVALLVADVLERKGMGVQLCGRELWAEFLRATGYHEQKQARRDVQQSAQSEPGGAEDHLRRPVRAPGKRRPRG
jgi:hypothetical protein